MGTRLLLPCLVALLSCALCHADFAGKEFATAFMQNWEKPDLQARFVIQISALHANTKVKVRVDGLSFAREKTLGAGEGASFPLPHAVEILGSKRSQNTVVISANQDVTVGSLNHKPFTSETSVVYPVTSWGTEYHVFTPRSTLGHKEFSVTNHNRENTVTIIPTEKVTIQGKSYGRKSKITFKLKPFESLQVQSTHDLTGSVVRSVLPIAVSSGHTCTRKFSNCDHVYEQLIPVQNWGKSFMVVPLEFQTNNDYLYIQASQDTEVVIKSNGNKDIKNLKMGKNVKINIKPKQGGVLITANHGVQVLYLFTGVVISKTLRYDPFLMTVLPTDRFGSSYTLNGQAGFESTAIFLVRKDDQAGLSLDSGSLPSNVQFTSIPGTEFSWAEVSIKAGWHSASHPTAPFGLYIIGVSNRDGYGSPALCGQSAPLTCSVVKCGFNHVCKMINGRPTCVPKPVTCWAMGDPHYKSWDGKRFNFMGTCTYIIAKNCEKNSNLPQFIVETKNENRGNNRVSYVGQVTVKVYGFIITVARSEYGDVRVGYNRYSLPVSLWQDKLKLFQWGRFAVIQTDFGLIVQYNWNSNVLVTLSSNFAGKVCGLCGNFNGNPNDDFITPTGSQAANAVDFGRSWKVAGLAADASCRDDCVGKCDSCDHKFLATWRGESFCGLMSLANGPFRLCNAVINPQIYFENCVFDVCMGDGLRYFLCQALEGYASACQEAGIEVFEWRKLTRCPITCPDNSHYELCGSGCPPTCDNPTGVSNCSAPCVESCVCDAGNVLSGGKCIPAKICGCYYKGRHIPPGESFWDDNKCEIKCSCNPLTNKVECRRTSCKAGLRCQVVNGIRDCFPISYSTCAATGDPHYRTFDKRRYDFQGTCVYLLVGVCSKRVDLVPFEVLVQNEFRGRRSVSFTKQVLVNVYGLTIDISRGNRGRVLVNGELTHLPVLLAGGKVRIYRSCRYAVLITNFGLRVRFDWRSRVFVRLPSNYMEAVCGLCGNYNSNPQDDLTKKDGTPAATPSDFGKSWRVRVIPGCVDDCDGPCPECSPQQRQLYGANAFCGLLSDPTGPFRDCHAKVDPNGPFKDCVYDVCLFDGRKDILCKAISDYATSCQESGAEVYTWRSDAFCPIRCPLNSHYELCSPGCPATCQSLSPPQGCDSPCQEGCTCDDGFILSGDLCVPFSQCGCVYNDRYYRIGDVFFPNGKCEEECKCKQDGEVVCSKFSCGPNEKCEVADGVRKCQPVGSGECVASGDPHYASFDGRRFDFQGTCTYILAEGCGLEGTHLKNFSVKVKNARWDRAPWRKVSVTEMVVVEVYGYTVTILKGAVGVLVNDVHHNLPVNLQNGAVEVHAYGGHYFLRTNFGLLVVYNRVYYVRVKVPGNYRGKTCGLCGDFNDIKSDDFRLPDGTVTNKVNVFGAAWKVPIPGVVCDDGCVPGVSCPNCDPLRKAIFEGRDYCGLLKDSSGPFAVCHRVLDPTPYFIDCVFDICASWGDRKALCDSAAAYAADCAQRGVKVKPWRTLIFCPWPCPPNSHYEMCAGNCANVCPDLLDVAQCPRFCTEGCECNQGFLFNGESCIPEEKCGCYDNGRSYKPGEVVLEDDCNRKCTCNPFKGLICTPYSCPAGTQCLIRKGVMGCFNTDPCVDIRCRVKEKCRVVNGEAVCEPLFCRTCWAWGDPHYGTLDGFKYNFQGTCKYVISKTCGDIGDLEPFSIEERNDNRGNRAVSFVREVYVTVYGHTFTIIKHHFGKVLVDGEVQNLPVEVDGDRVTVTQKRGKAVLQTDFGLRVIYNWRSKLIIRICSSYYDSLCGLCGNFNGEASDDPRNPAGVLVPNVNDWAKSWKVFDPNDTKCLDVCEPNCPVCDERLRSIYLTYCGALKSDIFKECIKKLDPKTFIDNCAFDMCYHGGDHKMLCEALETFVELCLHEGVIVKDWRLQFGCPMCCPPHSHFEVCASPCPVTCPFTDQKPVCAAVCTEDCVCDNGYVWSAGKCVPENKCGCFYQGHYYEPGQSFWADEDCKELCVCDAALHLVVCRPGGCKASERCVVEDGVRACRPLSYGICRAHGDPHYVTFDQLHLNFQGTCIYQLAALCAQDPTLIPFEVVAQNDQRGKRPVSTTKVVWVKVYGITVTISKHYPFKILVDGLFVSLPFEYNWGDLVVFISGWTAVVETVFGMRVTFDWNSMVAITLPNTYQGAVCGLCGNYNGNPSDDGMKRDGTPPTSEAELGESWRVGVVSGCISGCKGKHCHKCTLSEQAPYEEKPYCAILTDKAGPFRNCLTKVDPNPYLKDCAFDACNLKGQHVCDVLAAYVAHCQSQGVVIYPWRSYKTISCPPSCPKNSHYELCASGCPASCASMISRCHLPCLEGCRCNEGHLLSGDVCVPVADCGCTHGGQYYKKWEVFYPHGLCQERCQCVENCAIECFPYKCEIKEICNVVDGIGGCHPTAWGKCKIKGDPHFMSFDWKRFGFQGKCNYVLAKVCNKYKQKVVPFEVQGANEKFHNGKMTVVKTVVVMVYGYVITMNKGNVISVTVDDRITKREEMLPVDLYMGRINIICDVDHIVLTTDFKLRVMYNYHSYCVEIWVPSHYEGKMCGLCGNYNGKKQDDFMLPDGTLANNVNEFGISWAVNPKECKDF